MVELARELRGADLVHLGQIARITGLSENYLAQLAMSLKNAGLVIGVSGKRGGYTLALPAERIQVGEIVRALIGPISLTDCVANPSICLNSESCETRMIWAIVNHRVEQALAEFTLADLVDSGWIAQMKEAHGDLGYLFPERVAHPKNARARCGDGGRQTDE